MLERLIKLLLSAFVWGSDRLVDTVQRITRAQGTPRAVVLYYHAIKPELRNAFGRQMEYLCRVARPWRLDTDIPESSGRFAAVTFDDGYASVVENALPELKRLKIPFTIFFPTGSFDSRPSWVNDPSHAFYRERVLSRAELQALAAEPLVTVGSHSVTHPNFLRLDAATVASEFNDSKNELETVLGCPVELFSFPHGAHDDALVQQAQKSGYRRIFTIEPEVVDPARSSVTMGRVAVEPDDWYLEFRLKLLGAYRWQTWFRRSSPK